MKKINFIAALNLVAAAAGRRFSINAYNGGKLRVGGFDLPVIVDLSGLVIPPSIPLLIEHQQTVEATLGSTDLIFNDGRSINITGPVTGTSDKSQQVLSAADSGHQWNASIGALVEQKDFIAAGQSVFVNGQTFVGPVYVARKAILRETSVLPVGADSTTSVNLAASAGQEQGAVAMTFEQWLASLGLDPATVDPANKAALMSAFEAATGQEPSNPNPPPAAPAMPPVAATLPTQAAAQAVIDLKAALQTQIQAASTEFTKTMAATQRRIAEISAKGAGHPQIIQAALDNGWTTEKVELEVLKATQSRTRPTSFSNAEKDLPVGEVLEAAICMNRRITDHEKQYKPEILQAAHSNYRSIGLKQIFLIAAMANGYQNRNMAGVNRSTVGSVLGYAMRKDEGGEELQASFSVVSLPGILSNVANKEILQGYMEEDQIWREIAKVKSVNDFKQVTSYRMLDDVEYEELGPGGKIKSGALDEESYTRQAKTYAKMFSLTRNDIINDDLGAFDDLRARIGRGSAKKFNKIFWAKFIDNSTFFTSARTNYISGSTTNLGTDGVGLGLGVTQFRKMTTPTTDGTKHVGNGIAPKILLTPPEVEFNAEKLFASANLNVGSAAGEENIFARKYRPVVAWQLSDSSYTGYSTTGWYLLGDPGQMPTIVVSFLDGVETPTVETSESSFDTLGVQLRGYHDFGADMAEYLGGVKSKGAA